LWSEIKLWRAVIKRAILDCCGIFEDSKILNKPKKKKKIMQEADSWFMSDDFMSVCDFASIDESNVKMIKEKSIKAFKTKLKKNSTILSTLLDRVFSRFKGDNNGS
tara:strand:+ start:6127 stop:6444 length:318 start_codon:yes stop_codon:yes gene_type:complete